MLSTFIITLREGLETSLIIGILIAYLVKNNNKKGLIYLWAGIFLAVIISILISLTLNFYSASLNQRNEKIFSGLTSLLAVIILTWMVFWMKSHSKNISKNLKNKASNALSISNFAILSLAFLSIIREGLETSIFLLAKLKNSSQTSNPILGLLLGFVISLSLGTFIYKSTLKINLQKFFKITGVALILIASGMLTYTVKEFQSLGYLPGSGAKIYNLENINSTILTLLDGTLGISLSITWLTLTIYLLFLTFTLTIYLKNNPQKSK